MNLPTEITTTLLLARPAQIDIDRLRHALDARGGPDAPRFAARAWHNLPMLTNRNMYLTVEARDLPICDRRLDSALASGLAGVLREDMPSTVARHRAALTLTVGMGPTPAQPRSTAAPAQQEFDRMLLVCHAAAANLARTCPPLALHWGPSDQILSGPRFVTMADMVFPLPLFLHPRPVCQDHAGKTWVSLEIDGAEALVGQRLRTSPAPVELAWLMPRIYAFVTHLRATGQQVADGTAFATTKGERFTVQRDDDGALRLVLKEMDGKPVAQAEGLVLSNAA